MPKIESKPQPQTYQVQKGDSLSKILKQANPGISGAGLNDLVKKTAEINGLRDPNKIFVGQRLTLPSAGQSTYTQAKAPSAPAPKPYDDLVTARQARSESRPAPPPRAPELPPPSVTPAPAAKTSSGDWRADTAAIHQALGVAGNSESLTREQLGLAMEMAGRQYGVPKELLEHIAKVETNTTQGLHNSAATGLMMIESVNKDAYSGATNVSNDTIANIVYAARIYGRASQALTSSFEKEGLAPPTGRTLATLSDLVYNRGPGVAPFIARNAKLQGIDTNNLQEYFAGKGGAVAFVRGKGGPAMQLTPGQGVGAHGENSVLQNAVNQLGDPKGFSKTNKKDRSGDGDVDHYDVWIQRMSNWV